MPTYAIGDVQGCFDELQALLRRIQFNAKQDTLWFVGDLVNRGPKSLEVLRFVKSLGDKHRSVLGNHDLHLLSIAYGVREQQDGDTLTEILTAPDKNDLIDWLRHRPLLVHEDGYVLVHAGLAPAWYLTQAEQLAHEVERHLQGATPSLFLQEMYGNQPDQWENNLSGWERLRCITNYLTRMRFCYEDGRLELTQKGEVQSNRLVPWFDVKSRRNQTANIIFGHWAALDGKTDTPHVYALDTGCVWGHCLTAMRLSDQQRFQVKCKAD